MMMSNANFSMPNIRSQAPQIPSEPSVTGRLMQAQDMMELAESRTAGLRSHCFGEGENCAAKRNPPTTIRGMVDDLATRLASLCGELATINNRMGCSPEPEQVGAAQNG